MLCVKYLFYFIYFKCLGATSIFFFFLYLLNFLKINIYISIFFIFKNIRSWLLGIVFLIFNTNGKKYFYYFFEYLWPKDLLYGFNLLHPVFFYTCIFFVFLFSISLNIYFKFTLNIILMSLMFTLFLGMSWGALNTGWGFFWTDDRVEFILLYIILYVTYMLHTIKFKVNFWYVLFLGLILIFFILGLRLNIISTIHSFFMASELKFFFIIYIFIIFYFNFFILNFNIFFLQIYKFFYLFILIKCFRLYFFKINKNLNFILLHNVIFLLFLLFLLFFYYYIVINNFYLKTVSKTLLYYSMVIDKIFLYFNIYISNLYCIKKVFNFNIFCGFTISYIGNYLYIFFLGFFYLSFFYLMSILKIYFV